jgi:predicted DNA-binding protein (MmcQ/YjbR family)
MHAEDIRLFSLSLPETEECFPFDEVTLVFKVAGKCFLFVGLDEQPLRFNAKAAPERVIALREEFPDVVFPGFHMNKTHWNSIVSDGRMSRKWYIDRIMESYRQVLAGMPKKTREPILAKVDAL